MPDLFVVIATPHGGDVSPYWVDNFIGLEKPVNEAGVPLWSRLSVIRQEVAVARNLIAERFMQETNASHLLFWDDDVLVPPDSLMRLLDDDAPIVSGFYTSRQAPAQPIAYRRAAKKGHHYQPVMPVNPGKFLVDGCGAGFLLIRRDVFAKLRRPWFQFVCGRAKGSNVSEDFYFCEKAIKAGYQIIVDSRVSCGHVGRYIFDDGDIVQGEENRDSIHPHA